MAIDPEVSEALERADNTSQWIWDRIGGLELSGKRQALEPAIRFRVVIDLFSGLQFLIASEMPLVALPLLRSIFEGCVRGYWLLHSPEAYPAPENGSRNWPHINTMVASVEAALNHEGSGLSNMVRNSLKDLHGLAHVGSEYDEFYLNDKEFTPVIPIDRVVEMLRWAGFYAMLAGSQIAFISGDQNATEAFIRKAQELA